MLVVSVGTCNGEADSSGTFKIEDVGALVPWVWVILDVVFSIVDDEGTVLLEKSEKRGAAWATIEPHDNGVVSWVAQRRNENVVKLLCRTSCQIAGEPR